MRTRRRTRRRTTALLVEEEFDAESLVAASREDFEELGIGAADCTRLMSYIARRQQAEKEEKTRADEARRRRVARESITQVYRP